MQDVRELVPEDDETNDENDRQKHHADEIVDELIVLPRAPRNGSVTGGESPQG